MIFDGLSDKLQDTFKKLKGKGKLTEKDIKSATREIKIALLEADVNFKVVKDFIKRINERAIGSEVMQSLTPGQQVIKIVNEELTELMGGTNTELDIPSKGITTIMLVGLQGAGKTTTAAKLTNYLMKKNKKVLLVACDVYRPAAIKQLQVLGEQIGTEVFTMGSNVSPVNIAKSALKHGEENFYDVIIIDTAGRLHVDKELMNELKSIEKEINPREILLNVDAMTGQDAVTVAESFDKALGITGLVLTKLDGDTRGGAALSITAVTGKHIKFVGMGEKIDEIEPFYPDRMASRILGMGDVLSLIEKAQNSLDEQKAIELQEKILSQQFTLEDFKEQVQEMKKMGSMSDLLEMIPGFNKKAIKGLDLSDKELKKSEAIIDSMTAEERKNTQVINASRRKRIALGSGTKVQDVNKLLKGFEQSKKMMKQLNNKGSKRIGKMKFPF